MPHFFMCICEIFETFETFQNRKFVQGYAKFHEYIVAQAPTAATRNDFWQMIWEHNCQTLVILYEPSAEFPIFWPEAETEFLDSSAFFLYRVPSPSPSPSPFGSLGVDLMLQSAQVRDQNLHFFKSNFYTSANFSKWNSSNSNLESNFFFLLKSGSASCLRVEKCLYKKFFRMISNCHVA